MITMLNEATESESPVAGSQGRIGATSAPAAPTHAAPTPNATAYTRRTSVPITRAPKVLSAVARISRPSSVRNRKSQSAAVRASATPKAMRRATSTNTGPSQIVAAASVERARVGSGPNASSAVFSRISATPSIRRICISCGASRTRSTSPRWTASPRTKSAAAAAPNAT